MLQVFNNFFTALHAENIIFCNWKGHSDIKKHLNGDGDIDLYVSINQKTKFEEIAKVSGFRRVTSYQASHDYIEHYYGLDKSQTIFVHIHVYFKIITGEHISKNYELPIENYLILNMDTSSPPLSTMSVSAKHSIFLIRYFLKIGSMYGLMQYFREFSKYSNEWQSFDHNFNYESLPELSISVNEFKEMHKVYESSSFIKKLFFSIKFKKKLIKFRRRRFFDYHIFTINNLIIRSINKFLLKKQKILSPGIVVAICGLDGSGKSSLVSSLQNHFSEYFNTTVFHLGRPSSNILTFVFNAFVSVYSFVRRLKPFRKTSDSEMIRKNVSLVYAIRSVLLAYDRKVQSNKAFKYSRKGYLVICDRYPGLENGKMDSPRILIDKSKGFIYQFCYNLEQNLYKSINPAEFIFQLSVPLDVAIHRNRLRAKYGKETEDELRERFALNSGVKFLGKNYHHIDATPPFDFVLKQVIDELWNSDDWS